MNASTTREAKTAELVERIERFHLWADGFDMLADQLEQIALPVNGFDDVRRSVVGRLHADAVRARLEAERAKSRLVDIAAATAAAAQFTRSGN